jgi:hypothetical protein
MATVLLLYSHRIPEKGEATTDEGSVFSEWTRQYLAAVHADLQFTKTEARRAASNGYADSSESIESCACLHTLMVTLDALVETMRWARAQDKSNQLLSTKADEDGNFEIAIPRPGVYYILAHGRVGFNDAFWGSDSFNWLNVEAGSAYTVKLSRPETACLTME